MGELAFHPDADQALTRLERSNDPVDGPVLAGVNKVLDGLAADPGQAWLRRHRFTNGLWGVLIDDWLVLWAQVDDVVYVEYIGPSL